jgi:hypothetical protein
MLSNAGAAISTTVGSTTAAPSGVAIDSSANALGLTNAFASVNKLVNTAMGTVSGPTLPAVAILSVAKIKYPGRHPCCVRQQRRRRW